MILIILFASIIAFFFYHFYLKRIGLPPGPLPLPFVGNTPTIRQHAPGYEAMKKWAREYGPVYTIWLGAQPMVIITDYELIKQHILKDGSKYAARNPTLLQKEMMGGEFGVIQTSENTWTQHRRFALQVLRDFGLGKNLMEQRIISEVQHFLKTVKTESLKGPVDLQDHLDASVGSIINNLLFGYRFDESNMAEFLDLKAQIARQFVSFSHPAVIIMQGFPFLSCLPYFSKWHRVAVGVVENLFALFRRQIAVHRKEIDYDGDQNTDYVEAYLKEQKKHEHEPDFGGFNENQLLNMCRDLWVAGMETTSNTLYWGVLYVLRAPEILKKIHQELDTVISSDRIIESNDRSDLHYVNAVVHEVQRMSNLVPLNVPHRNTEDVVIAGFQIPKNTVIVPQICAVLADEKIFPEPYKFDPTRHLDKAGHFVKMEELIPFGVGKRACLGEGIARAELFLFLANFYNTFNFKPEDPKNLPTIKKNMGATMKAENFKCIITPRFKNT